MSPNLKFIAVMGTAVLCLGLVPLFEKLAVDTGAGLFPLVISINLMTVLVLSIPGWRERPHPVRRDWPALLVIGGIASGAVVLMNLWALETTSATHRSVFQAMYPAAAAIFALWILGERLPLRGYLTIAAMIAGIVVLSGQGLKWEFAFGDLLLFATVPLMGFCDAWAKRSLGGLNPAWVALGRFAFGSAVLLVAGTVSQSWQGWPVGKGWLWVLLSGVTIGIGVLMLYRGMALKGAALAAAMISLAPVITAIIEWLWLGTRYSAWEIGGMITVIGGGILLTRPRFQKRDHARPLAESDK